MATKEQKLMATEHFLHRRHDGECEVINLEDDMTYADFAIIDDAGIGIVYVGPDNDSGYLVSRNDFERDAIKVLSHYVSDDGSYDVYPIIITFMFIDGDETRALIRGNYRPPFREEM